MDKQKQIQTEELIGIIQGAVAGCATYWASLIAEEVLKYYQPKIPEGAVVIDRNENPCLSCPVPKSDREIADCSTICGAIHLGIDWKNQCRVLVKDYDRLEKDYENLRKETAEEFAERLKAKLTDIIPFEDYEVADWNYDGMDIENSIDEICKEISEGE